jgi:16S rRNA (guanine527-N7)-methyltransferase
LSSSVFVDRLFERAAALNISVSEPQTEQLERYYELLRLWNRRINLTALPLEAVPGDDTLNRLFLEPLIASTLVANEPIGWLDVGSGGGSPAIPLKVVRSALNLTMVEARERKAAFLREAVRHLGLTSTQVLADRVEALPESTWNTFDLITVRGVRPDATLLGRLAALLQPAGRLMMFGRGAVPEGFELIEERSFPWTTSSLTVFRPIR